MRTTGFVFADAYPSASLLLATADAKSTQHSQDLRMPINGSDVLLLVSLHVNGIEDQDDLVGRATLPISVGLAADHSVVLRGRQGEDLQRASGQVPSVHIRVAYGSAKFERDETVDCSASFVA